jgi:hypothetical protein
MVHCAGLSGSVVVEGTVTVRWCGVLKLCSGIFDPHPGFVLSREKEAFERLGRKVFCSVCQIII